MSVDQNDVARAMMAEEAQDQGLDVVGFLLRRKWLIVFGLVVGLSLGYLYFVRQPEVFQSIGQVLVVKQMPSLPITGTAQSTVIRRQDFLANDIYLIRSKEIVKAAIEKNQLTERPTLKGVADPVQTVINGLTVNLVDEKADVLDVRFSGPYPDDCGTIVNAVIDSYSAHLKNQYENRNTDTKYLLDRATNQLSIDIKDGQEQIKELRKNSPLLWNGDAGLNPHQAHVNELDAKIAALQAEEKDLVAQLQAIHSALQRGDNREALVLLLQEKMSQTPEKAGAEKVGDPIAQQLLPLQLQLDDLLLKHGAEHPEVIRMRNRIDTTRAFLREQLDSLNSGTKARPTDLVTLYVNKLQLELATNKSRAEEFLKLKKEEQIKAEALQGHELEIRTVMDHIDRNKGLYNAIVEKLKELNLASDSETTGYHAQMLRVAPYGHPIAPNLVKILAVAGLLGILSGLLLAYGVETADQSFKSPEEISHLLHMQIIGHCPLITSSHMSKEMNGSAPVDSSLITYYRPKSRAAEAFRAIRTALYFSTRGAHHKVIQVTSPNPGDGKSTLISNVAVTIAQSGKRVLLIDADFRRPRVHKLFHLENNIGISSAILGEVDLMDAICSTPVVNLDCLPCGPRPDNPSELLTQNRFGEMLQLLREKYDFVLLDTPPVLAVTDPSAVAPRVDGVLLCIRVNNKSRMDAVRATELLAQLDANTLGIVVNGIDAATRRRY
ncbi:MAG: polysaccharide biosynthesis tyrosine autokinase, partial [Planctomycetaceae bacterium]|nr:polysaccharide biosynthesis tyrosine autokinase [Planctomycetaceae bacterium]